LHFVNIFGFFLRINVFINTRFTYLYALTYLRQFQHIFTWGVVDKGVLLIG